MLPCPFFRWSTVRNTWCVTTATGPWCQTWETFCVTFPLLSSSWSQTPCSWCGSTFWKHFRVCSLCLNQLDSSIKLTVPSKKHVRPPRSICTQIALLQPICQHIRIDTSEIGKDRFMICLHKESKGLGLPATRRYVVIYHISSFCNWCLIWVT